jgi:hypothetical protein
VLPLTFACWRLHCHHHPAKDCLEEAKGAVKPVVVFMSGHGLDGSASPSPYSSQRAQAVTNHDHQRQQGTSDSSRFDHLKSKASGELFDVLLAVSLFRFVLYSFRK